MSKPFNPTPPEGQPFDLKKCLLHRRANSYGMPLNYSTKCDCCGRLSQKEELTFDFSLVKIYYCGPQLATYLTIVKYLAILLFLLCITNALPLLIINSKGKDCEETLNCAPSILLQLSIFNQFAHHKKIREENYIVIANFIVCIVFWHIVRYILRKIKSQIEQTNFIPNEFAILCELPMRNVQKDMISESIQKWWRLEIKHNREKIKKCLPDIFQSQEKKQMHLLENTNLPLRQAIMPQKKQSSQYIQEIIFSYDYPDFVKLTSQSKVQPKKQKVLNQTQQKKFEPFRDQSHALSLMKRNIYCLIIFKKADYASYFSSRNNPTLIEKLACFEDFRYLYLAKKKVNVTSMHYPSEILWRNHHICCQQKWKIMIQTICFLFLVTLIGFGFTALLCWLYKTYVLSNQSLIGHAYYVLIGLLINLVILVGNKVITFYSQKQSYQTYVAEKSSYIYKIVFFNICLILLSPLVIFTCLNTELLWRKNGFIETEVISLVIYMLAIQIERYLAPSTIKIIQEYKKFQTQKKPQKISQKLANRKFNRPSHKIERQYAAICTITFMNFFLSSFAPYVTIMCFLWMLFQFFIEKVNICYFYNEDKFHSQLLSYKVAQLIEKSFSFLIYGNMSVYIIRVEYFHEHAQIQFVCIFTILCAYSIFSIFLPHEKINIKLSDLFKNSSSTLQESPNSNYFDLKDRFLQFYEDFNEALSYYRPKLSKDKDDRKESEDYIQSLSASLSLSLKQRLMHHNEPIIHQIQQQPPENDDYFEYERKINMKKTKLKVDIPRLFQKNKPFPQAQTHIKPSQEAKE